MSRALALAATLALVAAVSLTPDAGPLAGTGRAAAADCAWQRHAKRVVKRVKRDDRTRRVVRVRRWWSCDPPAPSSALAAPPVPTPVPGPPPPEPQTGPARLSVKALEFSFTLSRPSVPAGEAIVELNNQGEDPHNLKLQSQGGDEPPLEVPEAGPLENRTGRFDLAAGAYRLWCSLPQHDEWGMNATLTVAAG